jgi:tRNA-(ms[2]io[6]A)-hydroxylase
VKLKVATPPRWLEVALADFDSVLIDHAHCEKKAASNALSMLQVYPDIPGLPSQMARLAREESAHLAKVLELLEERGLSLGRDHGDPYARGLQELIRNGHRERRLDRLLIAGIIESRSHERLQLLADALEEPPLRKLYAELARSEDGHQKLFERLAGEVEEPDVIATRLDELLTAEAALLKRLPLRAAIH